MGNNLNTNIEKRFVLLREDWFRAALQPVAVEERVFLAEGGFGTGQDTMGTAVFGEFLADGEQTRVEGYHLDERFPTVAEIESAFRRRLSRNVTPSLAIGHALVACGVEA